jgi:hypothetical protein
LRNQTKRIIKPIKSNKMTDIEVFKKFMEWMHMEVTEEKQLPDGNTLLIFTDTNKNSPLFTKVGYSEFDSGIIYDKDGNMVKAYLDSHEAYASDNWYVIREIETDIDQNTNQ